LDRLELTALAQDKHFWFRGARRYFATALDAVARRDRITTILDCGCGTGAHIPLLSRYGRVVGLDLSPVGLTYARREGSPLVRADLTRIPFPDAAFDLVASFDVFESLPDDRAVLGEMVRVLKPGGAVVWSAPALEALRGDHSESWEEVRRYTPSLARRLAVDVGLDVERVSFLFPSLAPLMYVTRLYQRRRRRRGGPRPDADIRVPAAPINAFLSGVLRCEAVLVRLFAPPFGSSVLMVARKPAVEASDSAPAVGTDVR